MALEQADPFVAIDAVRLAEQSQVVFAQAEDEGEALVWSQRSHECEAVGTQAIGDGTHARDYTSLRHCGKGRGPRGAGRRAKITGMKRRLRRMLIGVPVVAVVVATLTWFEHGRLAETVSAGGATSGVAVAAPTNTSAPLDVDRMLDDVRQLASAPFEGRLTGSAGGARARALIAERFRAIGLMTLPALHGYLQPFSFTHTSIKALWRQDRPFRKGFAGVNIVGVIPPRSRDLTVDGGSGSASTSLAGGASLAPRYILLSAHYDHLGVRKGELYPGADDNASGVAALLAIAAYVQQHLLSRGVIVAAFDGEEEGLRGASAFVAQAPVPIDRIDVAVNMDMISRSATSDITVAGLTPWPALAPVVTRAANASPSLHVHLGHDRPFWRAGLVEDWTHASDHGPFHDAGVPFLYVGVEDHDDYHRPTDTADRIDKRFYAATAGLVLHLLEEIDRDPAATFRQPPERAATQ